MLAIARVQEMIAERQPVALVLVQGVIEGVKARK